MKLEERSMKLGEIIGLLNHSCRIWIVRDNKTVFLGFRENLVDFCKEVTGEELIKEFCHYTDTSHVDWKRKGLLPPLIPDDVPDYIIKNLRYTGYYRIEI